MEMDLEKRLRTHYEGWQCIGASDTVLNWIKEGVPIIFDKQPLKTSIQNPCFSIEHRQFIRTEIKRLLSRGALEHCKYRPNFISPLNVVPKKNNKLRLITNLSNLNINIKKKSFRNEDIRTTMDLVKYDDEMVTVDLTDCFYHIPVREQDRDYLGIFF